MGILQKTGDFLGISKFGQGLASTYRNITGANDQAQQLQQQDQEAVSKLLYASRQEKDPTRRAKLLAIAQDIGKNSATASQIDPGLNLSNKEIIGSASNVLLNVATPGAFKGGTGAILAKNTALGAGYGLASGLEKNRSAKGIAGSTVGGAVTGLALGGLTVGAKALKDFTTKTTPQWLMDKAVKPTLDEARKNLKYGQDTFGKELLDAGVKGGPKRLLEIADEGLTKAESELQTILMSPEHADKVITKSQLVPYLKDLTEAKAGVPGLGGDVKRIENLINSIPETMSIGEANIMKRRIYNELRDVSYKLDAKLSAKGKGLKAIASGLKTEIENAVGGNVVSDLNKKLSLYGRLETRIVDQMARDMRNNSFGLTDAILTAGGVAGSVFNPDESTKPLPMLVALLAITGRHAGGSTAFRTTTAQGLNKLQSVGTGKTAQGVKEVVRKGILNLD